MKRTLFLLLALAILISATPAGAKKKVEEPAEEPENPLASPLAGFKFREIGPALTSGRISDIVVHPEDKNKWYVTAASGGVWLTSDSGTTWTPIFDDQGSYSIGCVTLDPNNPSIVWVGTGENNSQRSVSYGDGVYKSMDGGKSWERKGLEESEHIGRIVIDPRDSDVVYVAAHGPLWKSGGDRGLFKTTDGGENWAKVLDISENTGVNEVWHDPRNPDVLYASSYQRRRRIWTLIDGGPESTIYKSTDAGVNWEKIEEGLPEEDKGKIGLAISPADPDVIYALVESVGDKSGTYRSVNGGQSWERRSDYGSASPQYYNELIPDPVNVDRVYSMDTWMHVTEDGGATWTKVPETSKHVDNHALWIDPDDTDHLIAGCDGGLYVTWNRGESWRYIANLPVTQFYKIAVDNDLPFYNVYGGTQDNSTLGGPSRNTSEHGITNRDWFITVGGDGFKPAVDPENPDIVYSQWQYGNLVRYDRKSGERVDIKPQPEPGEDPPRWNWDSALLISPHSHTRLYFSSQRVYRSEDRGDSWKPISPDLTRNLNRNELEVMGKVWGVDTVAKNHSTSFFGNIVSLAESPVMEDLLYAGTDDGLIQVTEDGGQNWRKVESFPGVPNMSYVADLEASWHDGDTVYAALEDHKSGDFKPYLMKSVDRGLTWTSITGDLPDRGSVLTIVEDHVNPELLFAGTEFGVFVTLDAGQRWTQLKSGIPVVAVRDLVIQQRENDLVVGTLGRGIYILDDYSPLRSLNEPLLESEAVLFPTRDAWMFMKSYELGYNGKSFMGASFYSASNPPLGAVFTYYLKDGFKSLEEQRQEQEKKIEEEGGSFGYPSWEELRAEDRAEEPAVILTIKDEGGNVVRRVTGPRKEGVHRIDWDFRYPAPNPSSLSAGETSPFSSSPRGPMASPGTYTATLARWDDGGFTELGEPVTFQAVPIGTVSLPAADKDALVAFQKKSARLQRAVIGATRAAGELQTRIDFLRVAALDTPDGDPGWLTRLEELETRLDGLKVKLNGDSTVASRSEPTSPSISSRVGRIVSGSWSATSAPTGTQKRGYEIAAEAFEPVLQDLSSLTGELESLESEMEAAGAPWTPGRLPTWSKE